MVPLPSLHTSKSDFASIRHSYGLYVDKTPCFRDLLAVEPRQRSADIPDLIHDCQLLARPRRFGKSMLVSTLEAWFQGLPPEHLRADTASVQTLLDAPAGWTSPAWLWEGLDGAAWHGTHGWRPVVRLDMSSVASTDPQNLEVRLGEYLADAALRWSARGVRWGLRPPAAASSPPLILLRLIEGLHDHYGHRPVVLVDEYDAPLTEFIGTAHDPAGALSIMGSLYGVLKAAETCLYGVFLTGITRLERVGLFSGLNNLLDRTHDGVMAGICGFTEQEVTAHFTPYFDRLRDLSPDLASRDIQAELSAFYNGYRFCDFPAVPSVYNPYTLLEGMQTVLADAAARAAAAQGRWPTRWSASGNPSYLIRLVASGQYLLPDEADLFNWSPSLGLDLRHPDYTTLMLQTGYYTLTGGDPPLAFPNQEVRATFAEKLLATWGLPTTEDRLRPMRDALTTGDVPGFIVELQGLYSAIAYENLSSESACRGILQALLILMTPYSVSEKHTRTGRSDHEAVFGDCVYVFEVKFDVSAEKAWDQLVTRGYGQEHMRGDQRVIGIDLHFPRSSSLEPITYISRVLYPAPPADGHVGGE